MIPRNQEGSWQVDRHVPVALIVTLIVGSIAHTGALVWWASGVDQRLSVVERLVDRTAPQADRLTRVETKLDYVQSGLDKIEALLRQRAPERPPERHP